LDSLLTVADHLERTYFHINAKRFETDLDNPISNKYPAFKEMLDYSASENRNGYRNEQRKLFKT